MKEADRDLLEQVRLLHNTLTQRVTLLRLTQSNVDVFVEGMRDLGQDFCDLGTAIQRRVTELDAVTSLSKSPPREHVSFAGRLAELAMSLPAAD